MDANSIVAIATGVAGVLGGYWGGRRVGTGQAVSTAVDVVDLLQVQVNELIRQREENEHKISTLEAKVEVLEGLVTQRAEVEAVRGIVERIAATLGA